MVLDQCNLLDLGSIECKYAWFRKVEGARPISKRLDRALSDCDWRHRFPEAFVENLCRCHSDQCPIFLRCSAVIPKHSSRPFCFQAA